jgi:hypothetical protein
MSALLCRWRANDGDGDVTEQRRLRAWLERHWTVDGPCFNAFPSLRCHRDVRDQHEATWGVASGAGEDEEE